MKTVQSLKLSARAKVKSAVSTTKDILHQLSDLDIESGADQMPKLRRLVSQLTQDIHEFNAYWNSLNTD